MASTVDVASSCTSAETEEAGKTMVALGGTQNMAWASDTSKFGFKMLVKMGWSAGKGVGKELQGQASHVKILRRSENLGVGCSLKQAEMKGWSETVEGFAGVLKTLNESYSNKPNLDGDSSDGSSSSKKKKKDKKRKHNDKKKDKKSKKSKKAGTEKTSVSRKLHYRKRLTNKNAKNYGVADMAAILGVAASAYKSSAE
ncbi:unnamed protein product [Hyaloperonospora brassicae]|uniref:PinX1-related protein 1 n=1 Tax=Hyaloperonospora brassicae TaxID=162125 RepID=A0AAV0V1Y3_HYABA|nr:unnamed protein product [Hyaloperonospora brassicae]